ncbi:hypothetical protein nbrc107696_40530 [Gordonia spumicola]|uniref:DoxX family protein n=1 Tax=Gordonia spumicola TaxID=589161 RepID=A0A7I9VE60_9ACTN|nr:hypothetical protein nbrc107696_40530 [Gordonia spumicola]
MEAPDVVDDRPLAEPEADANDTVAIEQASSPADVNDTAVIERPTSDDEPTEATTRLPLSDVEVTSSNEPVTTEPFAGVDDESDRPRGERRTAEHLTQDPLPYIEPQPTTPIEIPEYETEPFEPEPSDEPVAVSVAEPAPVRRGTLDLGLLILRLAVGGVFTVHGLQKLTGWMNGPGLDGFADFLQNAADPSRGFDPDVTKWLALTAGVSETAGGILLVLGLLTPIAGSAVLGSILVAMTYKATLAGGVWFFASDGGGNGVEFEIVLAAAAAALILTGPGLYSGDRRWGWARRPAWGSFVWLLIGVGAAVAVWVVFNGANPLVRN